MAESILGLAAAILLAAVHIFSQLLRFLQETPRSRFLSFAGGMAVSWAVLRTLPGLSLDQEVLERAAAAYGWSFLEHHVYLAVLASILVFYLIERLAKQSRRQRLAEEGTDRPTRGVFWLHVGTFAALNFLVGYALLGRTERGIQSLLLFALAMILKFVVNDHALYADHKAAYDRFGRWVLAFSVLAGWATAALTRIPETSAALLRAFIAGSVLFNMLKEELPAERESRAGPFVAGAAAYAVLLLAAG